MPNRNQLYVVVGLGKTGLSCVRYLLQQGQQVAITDSRKEPPGLAEVKANYPDLFLSLGYFDADLCQKADVLVLSPGVSIHELALAPALAKGIPVLGDVELFVQAAKAPIAAITGSNGKSTVTSLLGEMARYSNFDVQVGGNLGTPALDLLAVHAPDLYVLELSSFQLETTYSLHADAAIVLNISADHMDRYANLMEYLTAKQRIYRHCKTAIVNRDDGLSWQGLDQWQEAAPQKIISFGLDRPLAGHFGLLKVAGQDFLSLGSQPLMPISSLKIKGRHQVANALAALALGHALNLSPQGMKQALETFTGLPHRCQWVGQSAGVDWYNDSKATNVGAAQAAIEGLGAELNGKLIVIAGGQGKNADFAPLRNTMKQYVRHLILLGEDADKIAAALQNSTEIHRAESMEQAIAIAKRYAQPQDAVILAPACASFDMFENFEDRGDVFMSGVRAIL